MEKDIKILENIIYNDEGKKMSYVDVNYAEGEEFINAVVNLIARYKEVEDKNKTLETLLQGNLYQMYLYYKEVAGRYQANSISKDKVKEKIEELKQKDEENLINAEYFIKVLQELLEEES